MSYTCPACRRASENPIDEQEGYCGSCHDWTRDLVAKLRASLCAHCQRPAVGFAFVNDLRLCHPDVGLDCYHLATVYHHTLPCRSAHCLRIIEREATEELIRTYPAEAVELLRELGYQVNATDRPWHEGRRAWSRGVSTAAAHYGSPHSGDCDPEGDARAEHCSG